MKKWKIETEKWVIISICGYNVSHFPFLFIFKLVSFGLFLINIWYYSNVYKTCVVKKFFSFDLIKSQNIIHQTHLHAICGNILFSVRFYFMHFFPLFFIFQFLFILFLSLQFVKFFFFISALLQKSDFILAREETSES